MRATPPHILEQFPIALRHSHWAGVSEDKWADWIWQQQNRVKSLAALREILHLSPAEEEAFTQAEKNFRIAITPYYLSLMDRENPACPIRRQAVPQPGELTALDTELADPSGEDNMSPAPGIVHRYPDRVLLYTTHNCAVYCRFCTRKRKVSDPGSAMLTDEIEAGIDYIRRTPAIRDVVVSGGDALSNSDDRLAGILEKLRAIPHVQILRVGSRNLVTLPQRITPAFVKMLADFAPVYVHTHFNHPTECSRDAFEACRLLADAGIPLNNHTVLLKGINDSAETIRDLNHKLLMMRVRPYYLYQCDQVFGNSAFRTSVRKGLEVIQSLRGWTSGLAVPHFVVDTPGGGKVPLLPDYVVEEKGDTWRLRNYKGEEFTYVQGGE